MRISKFSLVISLGLAFFSALSPVNDASVALTAQGTDQPLVIYFFGAHGCAYCETAAAYLRQLQGAYPRLEIRDFDVYLDPDARLLYTQMLDYLGRDPQGMPTIIIGERVWVGFQESYQQEIVSALNACLSDGCPDILAQMSAPFTTPTEINTPQPAPSTLNIPIIGEVSLSATPLILSTLIIGFVDGFNPCSLWVLTVLLSLTLYMQSRKKTLLIGLTFIIISSLIYAIFISGLFTALSYLQYHILIQALVSLVALVFAAINIKDYFFFKQGPSLTISDQAKPGLYQRMRRLISMENAGISLIFGIVVLSAGVSLIEFSCTAGFPIIWVNLLAGRQVTGTRYALLLALYLLIYMLDELAIFFSVVISMRSVRLDENQGRFLKLLSGLVMLALALIMLIQPDLMNSLPTVLLVFTIVIAAAFLVDRVKRHLAK